MVAPLRTGKWNLSELKDVPKNGFKVFSCFHCGGGSTMGYKLAGYELLGGVEIDPEMMELYRTNHRPRNSFLMGVQEFNKIPDQELPEELFELDILDGSPPCSSFSMAGAREKKWNKETKFREGQAVQVLDDLFFHFIDTARKLRPKIVVAENVKGLILGNARGYVKEIFAGFKAAGYDCQLFLLNASRMGVPQKRERTFFLARRSDLNLQKINLEFYENEITVGQALHNLEKQFGQATPDQAKWWHLTKPGESFSKVHPKGSWFNSIKCHPNMPANTIAASGGAGGLYHFSECRKLTGAEYARIQTFPDDYCFLNIEGQYVCGMSVPPFMMQRIADQIERQWLSKI